MQRVMRTLVILVVLVLIGGSGWWWWKAGAREAALTGWLTERREAGWVAEAGLLEVRGFPNRLDAVVETLEIADPAAGWAWAAERVEVLTLAYDSRQAIVVWPGEQRVGSPEERVALTGETLRASLVFADDALTLDRLVVEAAGVGIASTEGWTATLEAAQLNTRRTEEGGAPGFGHDVALSRVRNLRLPAPLRDRLDPAGLMPEVVETAELDATFAFDAPWDLAAVEGAAPALTALSLRRFFVDWGELELTARGTLRADAAGRAEGEIEITARNWREMIRLAEATGALDERLGRTLEQALELIALVSGDGDEIEVPLTFSRGRMRLGPVTLGDAPRL
ncbi:MAG: DUF2125 domain-containing protein [Pseudomonadota bacterium]